GVRGLLRAHIFEDGRSVRPQPRDRAHLSGREAPLAPPWQRLGGEGPRRRSETGGRRRKAARGSRHAMKALRLAAIGAAVLLGMLGLHRLVYALMSRGHRTDLPKPGHVPPFPFCSERGRPVAARDLEKRVWIADFIFTRCGGTCPAMSERMAALAGRLRDEPGGAFVSFDVDPAHDRLADLAP